MRSNSLNISLLLLIILVNVVISEEENQPNATGYLEVGLFTNYLDENDKKEFVVEAISPVWNKNHMLTDSFRIATLSNIPEHLWQYRSDLFLYYGWSHCAIPPSGARGSKIWAMMGYAIYKISCTCEYQFHSQTNYFYLDWRDDRYQTYPVADFLINFDEDSLQNRFSYAKRGSPLVWKTIKDSSVVSVWEILGVAGSPSRVKFQPPRPICIMKMPMVILV